MNQVTHHGKISTPSVVRANGFQNISPVSLQSISDELGTRLDVIILKGPSTRQSPRRQKHVAKTYGVLAVSIRCGVALILSQLHETLLACTTNSSRIAAALLHGERSEHNGWHC